jgi:hypothetical protein
VRKVSTVCDTGLSDTGHIVVQGSWTRRQLSNADTEPATVHFIVLNILTTDNFQKQSCSRKHDPVSAHSKLQHLQYGFNIISKLKSVPLGTAATNS